jgi:hypothetical protein
MKIEKSYDLLNSEGGIITIEKIEGFWHYKFHKTRGHIIVSVKEILDSMINGKAIIDRSGGNVYFLNDYPLSMKGDDPSYYQKIIKVLLSEELEKCKDLEYFNKNYLSKCK